MIAQSPLNFPKFDFIINTKEQRKYIFDKVRKIDIVLTPEEWVRQHLIHYLHDVKGVPFELMAVEKQLIFEKRKLRFDLVVFNKKGLPLILAECKAPNVSIDNNTLFQAARYNHISKAPYIILTNGLGHYVMNLKEEKIINLNDLNNYLEIC